MCVAVLAEGVSNTFELGWWRPAYVNTGRLHFIMCPLVMFQERPCMYVCIIVVQELLATCGGDKRPASVS